MGNLSPAPVLYLHAAAVPTYGLELKVSPDVGASAAVTVVLDDTVETSAAAPGALDVNAVDTGGGNLREIKGSGREGENK